MPDARTDIAVVGAGAAGLLAAISAARMAPSLRVTLCDSRKRIGAKILMSGGTRCNVTNLEVRPADYHGGPRHFVKHVLEAFRPEETIRFFQEMGVELVLEPSGKYFPSTHSGRTVLEALVREAERAGVALKTGVKVTAADKKEGVFHLKCAGESGENFLMEARALILTTGGLSYPETGSDGTGYGIAKGFGHAVTRTVAALTPLLTEDEDWRSLSGVSIDAALSFFKNGKKTASSRGGFLFTHFGFSGPAALDLSRHWAMAGKDEKPVVTANFLPQETEETLGRKMAAASKGSANKAVKTLLVDAFGFPERLVEVLLKKTGFKAKKPLREWRAPEIRRLAHSLINHPLPVTGVYGYKKAEVTAGGVDLKEIRVATMESRRTPGLYFAGEILDVDGRIGGFNFQWAWSSGAVAGRAAAKRFK